MGLPSQAPARDWIRRRSATREARTTVGWRRDKCLFRLQLRRDHVSQFEAIKAEALA
jgi:hypothetical protein